MENTISGMPRAAEGVSASSEAPTTSPDSQQVQAQDPTKNLKAEFNRKFSKINEKLDQLMNSFGQPVRQAPAEDAEIVDAKQYVDARFQEREKSEVQQAQKQAWQQALELFPELDQNSENFDEKFYKAADKIYTTEFDLNKSKNAPLLAVKQAALELGKIEQLAKEKLLKDDARRSRMIAEGAGIPPREGKREKQVKVSENVRRLGIDPEKLKARIKANPEKYGETE